MTVLGLDTIPKPHPRYAQMAAAMRATGLNIKDTDFETIDALLERNHASKNPEGFEDADSTDLLIANALRESSYMSQDFKDADLLIAGFSPQTKQVLLN